MEDGDVSDFMKVHQEDLDEHRFQICWSCKDKYRPRQPVRVDSSLEDGGRHLIVTLNEIIYFNEQLPGEAKCVSPKIKHSRQCDKVYVVVEKQDPGMWL